MGCHSGKVASPSTNDGVKGTLLASPTAAAKSVEKVPSEPSPKCRVIFEGRWQDEHGKFVGIIRDNRLMRSSGATSQLRMDHTTGSIEMFHDDSFAVGCFVDGKITWGDGRVWFRQQDTMEAEAVTPPLEPALTDAQASSCRQAETHAENAVTENSEEVPQSKPTLAVTGDTSQEQHVQEVFQHERQSEAEIEHHMSGVKSGEAVVDASEAQDENVRSPSFSGVTDSKVVGDKSDIKPMSTVPRKERGSVCC